VVVTHKGDRLENLRFVEMLCESRPGAVGDRTAVHQIVDQRQQCPLFG